MSRYVMVRTQIRDMGLLRQTLRGMGHAVQERAQTRMMGAGARAEIAVQTPAGQVGFAVGADETIGAVGMEEVLRQDACKEFLRQVTRQYAREKVLVEAQRAGYRLVEEKVAEDNSIRLVVRKW